MQFLLSPRPEIKHSLSMGVNLGGSSVWSGVDMCLNYLSIFALQTMGVSEL